MNTEITKDNFIQQLKVKKSKEFFTDGQIYKLCGVMIKNYNSGEDDRYGPRAHRRSETAYNILRKLEGSIIKNIKTGVSYYVLKINNENTRVIELNKIPITFYIEQMMYYTFKFPTDGHLYIDKKLYVEIIKKDDTQYIKTNFNTFEILGKSNINIKDISKEFIKSLVEIDCVKNWIKRIEELEFKNEGSNYYRKLDAFNDKMKNLHMLTEEYYAKQNMILTPLEEYTKSQMSGNGIYIDIWRCPTSHGEIRKTEELTLDSFSQSERDDAWYGLHPQTFYTPGDLTVSDILKYQSERRHERILLYHNDPDLLYKQFFGMGDCSLSS